jgi:hypothetical protein
MVTLHSDGDAGAKDIGKSFGVDCRSVPPQILDCHPPRALLPAKIRTAETRRKKYDRRDAALLLELLVEDRFAAIWIPSTELRDLRALLRDRDEWVRIRPRVRNTPQMFAGLGQCGIQPTSASDRFPISEKAEQRRLIISTPVPLLG